MALKRSKKKKRVIRRAILAVKGGTFRLRKEPQATAAPKAGDEARSAGVLRFDSEEWRLPGALAEAGETEESNGLLPGRVVSVITILAVIFIAIMAWFVSRMPEK